MEVFTPQVTSFSYKNGSTCYTGTIEVAPCTLAAATEGDEASKYSICSAVARELRMQGTGFMSKVEWKKIKWTD
jgi:hypothetical protein